jgi:hypothetical protein
MASVDMRGADISHCKFGEDAAEEFLGGRIIGLVCLGWM